MQFLGGKKRLASAITRELRATSFDYARFVQTMRTWREKGATVYSVYKSRFKGRQVERLFRMD